VLKKRREIRIEFGGGDLLDSIGRLQFVCDVVPKDIKAFRQISKPLEDKVPSPVERASSLKVIIENHE
jgi:hypothetical protein